jgi:hypothetical protein
MASSSAAVSPSGLVMTICCGPGVSAGNDHRQCVDVFAGGASEFSSDGYRSSALKTAAANGDEGSACGWPDRGR